MVFDDDSDSDGKCCCSLSGNDSDGDSGGKCCRWYLMVKVIAMESVVVHSNDDDSDSDVKCC